MSMKLIRDFIVEQEGDTIIPVTGEIHAMLLILKAHEEVQEIQDSDCKDLTEYADVLTVLMSLASLNDIAWSDILKVKDRKMRERGGFENGRVLIRGRGRLKG